MRADRSKQRIEAGARGTWRTGLRRSPVTARGATEKARAASERLSRPGPPAARPGSPGLRGSPKERALPHGAGGTDK